MRARIATDEIAARVHSETYGRARESGTSAALTLAPELGERHGVPLHVQGLPMTFHVS